MDIMGGIELEVDCREHACTDSDRKLSVIVYLTYYRLPSKQRKYCLTVSK